LIHLNRVKKCFFFNHSALDAADTAKEPTGIENHRGGKQPSPKPKKSISFPFLDDGQLGGGDVKSIDVRGQAGESLLGAVGAVVEMLARLFFFARLRCDEWDRNIPDQSVDLDGVNIVQLLNSGLDLALVGLDVDNEDQGVVLLDLLHGALSVERVQNDLLGVELGLTGDGDTGVLGRPRELQGLGAVEGGRGANLAGLVKLLVGG
jgi:hypothetical protein